MNAKYSDKEKLLLVYFKVDSMLLTLLSPDEVYRYMMEKAFITNDQSWQSESLRRCIESMSKGLMFRGTKEFDNLIRES